MYVHPCNAQVEVLQMSLSSISKFLGPRRSRRSAALAHLVGCLSRKGKERSLYRNFYPAIRLRLDLSTLPRRLQHSDSVTLDFTAKSPAADQATSRSTSPRSACRRKVVSNGGRRVKSSDGMMVTIADSWWLHVRKCLSGGA